MAAAHTLGQLDPRDFVVLVIDCSKGKGRTLAGMLAKNEGKTLDEFFANVPDGQDPTLVRSMQREAAAQLVGVWNQKAKEILQERPHVGSYYVVVVAAGVTRVFDREPPQGPMAQA